MFGTSLYKELTETNILERVDAYNIYSFYLGYSPEPSKLYKSPFRNNDDTPSFGIKRVSNGYIHNDFGMSGFKGGCVLFVMQLYGLDYYTALRKINNDLGLGLGVYQQDVEAHPIVHKSVPNHKEKKPAIIQVEPREYTKEDLNLWLTWDIDKATLDEYNVLALRKAWLNKNICYRLNSQLAYAYLINNKVKIYKPQSPKPRFLSNLGRCIVEGFNQIPIRGNKLILTKSYKDVMMLRKYGYWAVAPSSENTGFPEEFLDYAVQNWKNIIVFFDNDEAGIKASNDLISVSGFDQIFMPTKEKDPTDYRASHTREETTILLTTLLN